MGADSKIEWTHHTWSPWLGCTPVSPACAHCYAQAWAKRAGRAHLWEGERERTKDWTAPVKWNAAAAAAGIRERVFPSLCDPFDNQVPIEWYVDFFEMIRTTPALDWLLLTKRPMNILRILRAARDHADKAGRVDLCVWLAFWVAGKPPANVWLGTTAENQEETDRRTPHLLAVPARVRFLSCEPLLSDIFLPRYGVHWVICGGESGPGHRLLDLGQARSLRDQCRAHGIAFLFKQVGGHTPKAGGRLLDGQTWDEVPAP